MSQKFWERLAWSFSRHNTLNECPKQYWFQYVAPNDYEISQRDRDTIWRLKNLESINFLRGSLIHDKIDIVIPRLQNRESIDENDIFDELGEEVEKYRATARETIAEFHNGKPQDESIFDLIRSETVEQMTIFLRLKWPEIAALEYLQHEKFDEFQLGSARIIVKLDYVGKRNFNNLVIVDWKTGNDDERYQSRLQLGGYALWAKTEKAVHPKDLEVILIFLKSGQTKPIYLTDADLKSVEDVILADWMELQTPKDQGAYSINPGPQRCLSCKFATICSEADLSKISDS